MTTTTPQDLQAPGPDREDRSGELLYELRGVERTYAKSGITVRAIRGVDLSIERAETVALLGPSGSGKSTLLQLLGALDTPSAGSLRFSGRELADQSDQVLTDIRLHEIGFVFQQFNLIPTLSALDNVAVAMVGRSRADQLARARRLLGDVGLEPRSEHLPSRLSGGEQQRVAIARALANEPRVVIADEPTGNLDSDTAKDVMNLLLNLQSALEVTIVIATHDEEIASRMARRIRLRDGSVLDDVRP